jgi:protein-S-isoprenylcysteine O-methyltransferase Ste14
MHDSYTGVSIVRSRTERMRTLRLAVDLRSERSHDGGMEQRERREAVWFHAAGAIACAAWWVWIARVPEVRAHFLGARLASDMPFLLLGPDLLALVFGGAWLAVAFALDRPETRALAWTHFGAAGYAWALSAACALDDARAYPGLVAMGALVAVSFVFALSASGASLLWGPFRFRPWDPGVTAGLRRASRRQTAVMWLVFFGAVPAALVWVERSAGWDAHWSDHPLRHMVGPALFVAGGALATRAAREMVRVGKGTPLPASCASELVCSGPYRWIRNPMATGSLAQGIGVALWIGSPLVLVYALAGIAAWEVLVRSEEETWLLATFGDAYARYRERVPCWCPRRGARP